MTLRMSGRPTARHQALKARAHGGPGRRRSSRNALAQAARLCVGASAILSWACGGAERGIGSTGSAPDSADQVMMGLRQFLTKDGVRQAYLQADTAFVYEASGRVDLRHVHVTFYSVEGVQMSVLTGNEGTYWTRTNQMSARGSVLVVRTVDDARLRTDFLEYDPGKNEVRTDRPYVADKGQQHFEGNGFVCDPGFTNCTTQGARGVAGTLVMPKP